MELSHCPDCGVKPGRPHLPGCDVERCSVCGQQKFGCQHNIEHDRVFARWTGIWPGAAEAAALEMDLNQFYHRGYHKYFFVKPKVV